MADYIPAFSSDTPSGLVRASPENATVAPSLGATAKAKPALNQTAKPSHDDHSSRARPYPVRAHVSDLRFQLASHPSLPPHPRLSVANQEPGFLIPESIPMKSWVDPHSCPLPKPPCRPWPCSLALLTHTSQDRASQVRPQNSLSAAVIPARRVFSARPALPKPYGPARPSEPSSTAQLQATLKDKCTTEWVLILKLCIDSSLQSSSASPGSLATPARPCRGLAAQVLGGHAVTVPPGYPSFSGLCESVCGKLASPYLSPPVRFHCRLPCVTGRGPDCTQMQRNHDE